MPNMMDFAPEFEEDSEQMPNEQERPGIFINAEDVLTDPELDVVEAALEEYPELGSILDKCLVELMQQ